MFYHVNNQKNEKDNINTSDRTYFDQCRASTTCFFSSCRKG
jgi:hypothetical protein